MLVLSRKANESIVIGGDIRVVVLALEGDHVKLGIDAPPEIVVRRSEIVDRPGPEVPGTGEPTGSALGPR